MSDEPVRPHPRIRRRTWLYLIVYALIVTGHFALIQAPGAVVELTSEQLRLPEGAELRAIRRLGDEHHALAAIRGPEGGAVWLLDWGRIVEVFDGEAELDTLRLAQTQAEWVPQQPQGAAGSWRWIEGPHSARISAAWKPPAAATRSEVGEDTLWEGARGPVDRQAIDAHLVAEGHAQTHRSARRLAHVSGAFALLRLASAADPTRLLDDLVLASTDDGQILEVLDTAPLGLVSAVSSGGFFFTDGLHSRLSKIDCRSGTCATRRGILSTGGGAIIAADDDPSGELVGLCTADGRLMLYALGSDEVRFLAEHHDGGGCEQVIVVDRQRLLLAGTTGWRAITLSARGGWLR